MLPKAEREIEPYTSQLHGIQLVKRVVIPCNCSQLSKHTSNVKILVNLYRRDRFEFKLILSEENIRFPLRAILGINKNFFPILRILLVLH